MPPDFVAVNRFDISMRLPPAVIVHGLADGRAALAPGAPVTLLSAPGAALYAGCLWWREMVVLSGASIAVLDCADAPGVALGALRSGMTRLVLSPAAPNRAAVEEIALRLGGFLLPMAPPALDLGQRGARRRLHAWLHGLSEDG